MIDLCISTWYASMEKEIKLRILPKDDSKFTSTTSVLRKRSVYLIINKIMLFDGIRAK